jgi:hypothetical protein
MLLELFVDELDLIGSPQNEGRSKEMREMWPENIQSTQSGHTVLPSLFRAEMTAVL